MIDKLVRNNVPAMIREGGDEPIIRVAKHNEAPDYLMQKMNEEADEWRRATQRWPGSKELALAELADMLEVLRAMAEHSGFPMHEVVAARRTKAAISGNFSELIIWEGNE